MKKLKKKRVIGKIFKLGENSQYGNGMTKPLPTVCIKDNSDISQEKINFLLEKVDFEIYVFQLLEQYIQGEKGPKLYKSTAKAHATLLKNFFFTNAFEDLAFCIKRAGWKVTKIYLHLTFKQARFKRKFILMNKKSRQQSKYDIKKDFYKLMNNSNFGYD